MPPTIGTHDFIVDLILQNFSIQPVGGLVQQDYLSLLGFAPGEAARALAAATTVSGSERLILSDGTRIQFLGVSGLTTSNFL